MSGTYPTVMQRRPKNALYAREVSAISVPRAGEGGAVLLIHGGASPDATWGAGAPLGCTRWTLRIGPSTELAAAAHPWMGARTSR